MAHPLWDPQQYGRYAAERLRPGFELMARIGAAPAGDLVDLGCGTGEHLIALAQRFPGRAAFGVDLSPEMLAKARAAAPEIAWAEGDIAAWVPAGPVAILFSNAALHWLGGHDRLIPLLFDWLAPGGWLALQMPSNLGARAHEIARELCLERGWREAAAAMFGIDWVRPPGVYYDLLRAQGAGDLDLWETTYLHALGPDGVTDWVKGTALRPILSALNEEDASAFLAEYDRRVRAAYPPQADGVTLYPQKRLFVLGQRAL